LGGKAFIDSCGTCVDTLNGEKACETSIKDKKNIVLGIWPNPFTKEFILQTESPSEFIITNLSGMGIASGTCNKTCKIGASLQSGVYFLTVSALSRQKTVKIIKME